MLDEDFISRIGLVALAVAYLLMLFLLSDYDKRIKELEDNSNNVVYVVIEKE